MRRSRLNCAEEEEEEQEEEEEMEEVGEDKKGGTSSWYRSDHDRGRERQTGGGGGGKGRGRGGNVERESGGASGGARDAVSSDTSGFQSFGSSQEPSDSVPEGSETDALSAARGGGKKKELMEAVRENPLTDLERMIEQDALGGEICRGMGWVFSSASPALQGDGVGVFLRLSSPCLLLCWGR
jgi:hypothetical protein